MKIKYISLHSKFATAIALIALSCVSSAYAASQTWTSTSDGNWSSSANWGNNTAPGSTSTPPTNTTDTATFSSSPGAIVTIDQPNQGIGSISFTGSSVGNFSIGAAAGTNALYLSSGGAIVDSVTNTAGSIETFAAPLVLEGTVAQGSGTYTFTNNGSTGNALNFVGNISMDPNNTTGGESLVLNGTNTTANTISGNISDNFSADGNGLSITVSGGVWVLSGANTFYNGLNLTAGTLDLNSAGSTGNSILTISGGTIDNTSGAAIALSNPSGQTWNGSFNYGGTNSLSFNTGGITLGASNITLTNLGAASLTEQGQLQGTGNLTVADNGAGNVALSGNLTETGSVTNTGIGSGTTTINGAIGSSVTAVTENSSTSGLVLTAQNTSFTGNLNIYSGTVTGLTGTYVVGNTVFGTGTIVLGAGSGSANATLAASETTNSVNNTFANSILIQSGSSGTLTMMLASSSHSVAFTGNIALNNNLTLANPDASTLSFATGTITEGSSSATITLNDTGTATSGAVTISDNTTVGAGGLTVTDAAASTTGTLTVSGTTTGTGNITISNNSSVANGITYTGMIDNTGSVTITGPGAVTVGQISNTLGSGQNNVTGLTVNTTNTVTMTGADYSTGTTSILAGTLYNTSNSGNAFGEGSVALGAATGTANATLMFSNSAAQFGFIEPITVVDGTTGTLSIVATSATVHSTVFAGNVALNNNLTLSNYGTSYFAFSSTLGVTGSTSTITEGSSSATITMDDTGASTSNTGSIVIADAVVVGSGGLTLLNNTGASSGNTAFSVTGTISGTGNLTITDNAAYAGAITDSGNITNTGTVTINNNTSAAAISLTGTLNNTGPIFITGSGTGSVTLGQIGVNGSDHVTSVTQNSPGTLILTGNNYFTGGLNIYAGTVVDDDGQTSGNFGSGAITLGAPSATANASLDLAIPAAGAITYVTNAITIQGSSSDVLSIALLSGASGNDHSVYLEGAIALNNSVTLSNLTSNNGSGLTIGPGISTTATITEGSSSATITMDDTGAVTGTAATGSVTVTDDISIGAGGLTVQNNTGANTLTTQPDFTFTGTVTSATTGNLTIKNNTSTAEGIRFTNAVINNSGLLSNTGTGSGAVWITGGTLGANVTGIVQNSASTLFMQPTISNFTGSVTVTSGTLQVESTNIFGATNTHAILINGGTLDVDGTTQTFAGLNDGGVSTGIVTNSAAYAKTLTLGGSGAYSYGGAITAATPADLALTIALTGGGSQTLNGVNTYTGATAVNLGTLALGGGGSLAGTAVTVGSGATPTSSAGNATLQINGNYTIGNSTAGTLTINGGNTGGSPIGQGTLNLVDGTTNTLTLANNSSADVLTIGSATTGNNSVLDMEVGAASDEIVAGSGTGKVLVLSGATAGTTANAVNITGLGNLNGSTQTLISGALDSTSTGHSTYANGFTLGTTSGDFNGYTVALGSTSTSLTLTETANASPTGSVYWYGAAAGATGGTTAWNSFENGNTNTSNFSTSATASSATNATGLLGAGSDVVFNATSGVVTGSSSTTLGQNFTIDSLTLNTSGVGIAAGGTNTLTINTSTNSATYGINVTATSGSTDTISAPLVLSNSQTWSVNSGDTLNVSGAIGGVGNALTLTGGGTLALSGTNTYTGATTIAGGNLLLSGSLASASTVTVGNGTATTAILSGTGTVGGNVSTATSGSDVAYLAPGVNSSGSRSDFGSVGTLHVGGNLSLGTGTNLDFDLSSSGLSGNDQIAVGGTLTIGTALTLNINELNGSLDTVNKYQLITFTGTPPSLSGVTFTTTGDSGYTAVYSIDGGDEALDVAFSLPSATPTAAFFNGQGTDLGTYANFDTTVSSGTAVSAVLGSTTNVSFNANRDATVSTATLNTALDVNSVTFGTGSGIHSGITINGTGTLTLEATTANGNGLGNGITVNSGGGNNTINTAVALDNDQTWTVTDATSTLTLGGQVSGAHMLSTAGSGVIALSNATGNSYTGGTSVGGTSTLLVSNSSNSATGTGSLTVNGGATIAGYGISSGTSFSISGSGTTTGTQANVLVGMNSLSDTNVSQKLTLVGSSASSIKNANLVFNLNASAVGGSGYAGGSNGGNSGTELSVGNTAVAFTAGTVTLTLDLQNQPAIVGAYTPYVLIAGTDSTGTLGTLASTQYSGLTLGSTSVIDGTTVTKITGGLNLAFAGSVDSSFYQANSYLVLAQTAGGVDDIDVVVVPEPGTWALMLGGLAMLVFWQRRRTQK